jgi:hypothetical protein
VCFLTSLSLFITGMQLVPGTICGSYVAFDGSVVTRHESTLYGLLQHCSLRFVELPRGTLFVQIHVEDLITKGTVNTLHPPERPVGGPNLTH